MRVISKMLYDKAVRDVRTTQVNGERGVEIMFHETNIHLFICIEENGDGLQMILFDGPTDIYRKFLQTR